ncbi:hypothetical protein G3M48_000734 [Beauveria asiatica]|uniref:GH16 domain-containing protein n=1 Tax=Beauveria asiatica TaxID=1069075 RepID=A0AAW0RGF8_9HYPO
MLGAFQNQAQSNYYYNSQPLFNTYNTTYAISPSSYDDLHTYTVEWTDTFLAFSIDGAERRTWLPGEIPPEKWPQTPMRIQLGLWAASPSDDPGEIAWAGGVPAWSAAQPSAAAAALFHSVQVDDYAGWCDEFEQGGPPVEYSYGGGGGGGEMKNGWADVRVSGCRKRREPGVTAPPPPATSGTSSASSSASATMTGNAEPTDKGDGSSDDDEGLGAKVAPSAYLALMAGIACMLCFW